MPLYQVELSDGRKYKVEADGQPSEEDIYAFLGTGAAEAPAEEKGYLSQLGTSLGIGLDQAMVGTRSTWNALTGDNEDLAQNLAAFGRTQQEVAANQTPADIKLNEALAVADKKWEQGDYLDSLTDIGGAVIDEPGAAFKTAVQSAPNAIIGLGGQLAGRALGAAAGGVAGSPTGPGAVIPAIGGYVAGGVLANSIMEAGPAIFDALNERTGGRAAQMSDAEIKAVLDSDPTIMTDGLLKGATRGSVIGLIESLGLYGAGRVASVPARAASKSALSALAKEGVDVGSREALEAALADPAKKAIFDAAEKAALSEFSTLGTAARLGAGAAIETGAAGAGEAGAQLVTDGEVKPSEVAMEMVGEVGLSPVAAAAAKSLETAANVVAPSAQPAGVPPVDPLGEVEPDMPDMTGEQRTAEEGVLGEIRRQAEAAAAAAAAPNPVVDAATVATETAEATASVAPETAATLASIAEQTAVSALTAQPETTDEGLGSRGTEEGLGTDSGGGLQPTGPMEVAGPAQGGQLPGEQPRVGDAAPSMGSSAAVVVPQPQSVSPLGQPSTITNEAIPPTLPSNPTTNPSGVGEAVPANAVPPPFSSYLRTVTPADKWTDSDYTAADAFAAGDTAALQGLSKVKRNAVVRELLTFSPEARAKQAEAEAQERKRFAERNRERPDDADTLESALNKIGYVEEQEEAAPVVAKPRVEPRQSLEDFIKSQNPDIEAYINSLGRLPLPDDIESASIGGRGVPRYADVAYLAAVEAGRLDDAQKMVDQAAREAGYNVGPVFHGGTFNLAQGDTAFSDWTHFGTKESAEERVGGSGVVDNLIKSIEVFEQDGEWFYSIEGIDSEDSFSSEASAQRAAEREALEMADNAEAPEAVFTPVYLRGPFLKTPDLMQWSLKDVMRSIMPQVAFTEAEKAKINEGYSKGEKEAFTALTEVLVARGIQGIEYRNDVEHKGSNSYIVFKSRGAKSATPVVRDDAGNVIPLSKRFNPQNDDIRYSLGEDAPSAPLPVEQAQQILADAGITNFDNIVFGNYAPLPNDVTLKGFVRQGSNKVHINLNAVTPENIVDVFNEEATHLVWEDKDVAKDWARLRQLVPQDQLDALRAEMEERGYVESKWDEEAFNDIARKLGYEWLQQPAWRRLWESLKAAVKRIFGLTDTTEINRVSARILSYAIANQQSMSAEAGASGESRVGSPFRTSKNNPRDAEYLRAVAAGDMATAQRIVDEAAREAGYDVGPVWHGTKNKFNTFELNDDRARDSGWLGRGFYFTFSGPEFAKSFGPNVVTAYLKAPRVLDVRTITIDEVIRLVNASRAEKGLAPLTEAKEAVIRQDWQNLTRKEDWVQFDGPIPLKRESFLKEQGDSLALARAGGYDALRGAFEGAIIVANPSQIKSAEAIVRNDAGEVIPPSERFNPEDPDIRYSLGPRTPNIFADLANDTPDSFDAYDRAKRATLGDPPSPTGTTYTPPRFTGPDHFESFFNDAYDRGDYTQFLEGFKATDPTMYRPVLKKLLRAAKLGDTDAADRAEWFRHVISGTIPPNAKAAPATPPPAKPGAPAPAPPVTPPAPPPPPPRPRVSSKPRVTLNTAAMVWMAKKLGETPVINRFLRRARGRFVPGADGRKIQLDENLFKDPVQAAKTLAHEIGHFLDHLPANIFRGNLAKRIAPLGDYKKVFGPLWDWSGGVSNLNKVLKVEAIELSKEWRGDFDPADRYRNSASELYADFVSAFLNDPSWTAQKAPNLTLGFLEALDNKPEVAAAYFNLVNIVKGGALYRIIAGERKASQETVMARIQKDAMQRRKDRSSFERAWLQVYTAIGGKYTATAAKAGGYRKNRVQRMENFGGRLDYVSSQEQAELYGRRAIAKVRTAMWNKVGAALTKAGIPPSYLDRYLLNQRIIKERTATGKYLEENPAEARAFLKWLVDTGTLGKDLIDQIDNAADEDLYNLGAKIIRQLHESDSFDDVYNAAQRVGAPPLAERGLFAFDVSGFMANPDGRTPESAAEDTQDIRSDLGDTLFDDLEGIATSYYDIMREVAVEANKVGLFKPEVWSERIEPNLDNYVPFMVLDYFTGHVDASLRSRTGTMKDTFPTHTAGEMKASAMIARIQRQKQALILKDFFETEGVTHGFADEMSIVDDPKMDRAKADRIEKEQDVAMVGFWDEGKYKWMKFKDPTVAAAIKRFDPDDLNAFMNALRQNAQAWRMWVTVLSIGFNIRNALRGVRTSWARLGVKNAKEAVKLMLRGIPEIGKYARLKSAYRQQLGDWLKRNNISDIQQAALSVQYAYYVTEGVQPSPALQDLLDKGILTPRGDFSTGGMTDNEVRAAVMSGFLSPSVLLEGHKTQKNWVDKTLRPIGQGVWDFMSFMAAIQESAPKISAYQTLGSRSDISEEKRQALARQEGIPNPGVGGSMNKWLEFVFLFWRVSVQGQRATLNSIMSKQTRGGFLLRSALSELAPKALYAMAAAGTADLIIKSLMGGDDDDEQVDLEEAYERLSPYKIYKDDALPLFWLKPDGGIEWMFGHKSIPETWTPIAVRIPASEEGRWASPASMYLASMVLAPELQPVDKQKFAGEFVKNFMPGMNPTFEFLGQYKAALFDPVPPRDDYRGRPIMPEDQWIDGGITGRMLGITKNLAAQAGVPMMAQGGYQNPNMPNSLRALLSMPGIKTVLASDNWYGVEAERRRRYNEKLAGAAARNIRGEETRNMVRRYESLETKGKDNRSDLEEDEFQIMRRWYNSDYNGSGRKRGLMDDVREAAKAKYADAPEVELKVLQGQAKDSAAALEESAKALREELRELRKEGAQ